MLDSLALGKFCKTSRKAAGLTLADFSTRTGIPVRSLARLEAGAPEAPMGRVMTVLRSLGYELAVAPLSRPALESLATLYEEPDDRDDSNVRAAAPSRVR